MAWDFKTLELENGVSVGTINPIHALYLDWLNNWGTFASFSDYYGLDENTAKAIIDAGRMIHKLNNGE
jgi:hypothetical protein